ncbi:hypothetical protein AAHE18_06G148000 [Arachis hypogaea]
MTSTNSYVNMPSTSYYYESSIDDQSYVNEAPILPKYKDEGEKKKVGKVDKIVNRMLDKYEKQMPATIRDQINLEELTAKERNKGRNTTSRGLDEEPIEQDKIQRFKIRTVVAQDIDKEDDDQTKK